MKFTAHSTQVHTMPEASTVSFHFEVAGSSTVKQLTISTSSYINTVHVKFLSNPDATYLYHLADDDVAYMVGQAMTTDSAGKFVCLLKKVATKVSKHLDGNVTFLTHTPVALAEAVAS
jgi:hypothetical protein